MKHSVFCMFLTSRLVLASACQNTGNDTESYPAVSALYAGEQEDNGFQIWIWIYEDETIPALVHSGRCRYINDQFVETDIEHLMYKPTENGFTLSDPVSEDVLYTATYVEKHGYHLEDCIHLSWSHSPGSTWDALAQEGGWKQEMTLWHSYFEGDDIREN